MTSFCVAKLNSRIKGHHVYEYKYTVNEELACMIEDDNKHSKNAIKVLFRGKEGKQDKQKERIVGHVPEPLAKILYPMMKKWQILSMKAVITGEKRRAPEGTWGPGGGVELPCIYYVYAAKIH